MFEGCSNYNDISRIFFNTFAKLCSNFILIVAAFLIIKFNLVNLRNFISWIRKFLKNSHWDRRLKSIQRFSNWSGSIYLLNDSTMKFKYIKDKIGAKIMIIGEQFPSIKCSLVSCKKIIFAVVCIFHYPNLLT